MAHIFQHFGALTKQTNSCNAEYVSLHSSIAAGVSHLMVVETKVERRQKIIRRIHRIQGQLNGLQTAVGEAGDCEQILTQARDIEKAVTSLIIAMIEGHLLQQGREGWHDDSETASRVTTRLFDLSHR
jgi:DNA-binding FrmR family transcriptional regulator